MDVSIPPNNWHNSSSYETQFNNSGGFPSRRSYPNLNHVSLAPLTPRFPIDDDTEPTDYFSPRDTGENTGTRTPPRTSYFSSVSVPSTPPILSHSRSTSRARHTRSKSSSRATTFSDTNLTSRDVSVPLHHAYKKRPSSTQRRLGHSHGEGHATKSDAEWMLRAGIALASSTREEKGQSWLSKRESSTSLVSESFDNAPHRHHHRTKSGSSRKSRSSASTPAALSRRSSRSRGGSRRGSRAGLAMTTLPLSSISSGAGKLSSPAGTASPEVRGRSSGVEPDFVDERIRAEMASLQERGFTDDESEFWDEDEESECDYSTDEAPDEFDEADLQRLTRERGFGLGSWIDRLVEWTLFGVEEWPAPAPTAATRIGTTLTTTTVTFEEPLAIREGSEGVQARDSLSVASAERDQDSDFETLELENDESVVGVEKPGSRGGWEDASWLFRVVKRAII
ncbi:hypothetical protein N7532_000315 [Penicillium argentinense]|uniref:Uncharacterized protein n=1 Tax=Penicillium argentinense TaxID=1131581 RepID=A0A9W9G514_9EURO|nr:uncharacterized protein N7532_000315 [Penicillium argentinense]KAJ5112270.1 hypothetical protein N7532_000315 [Penicillium argentinense]